MWVHNCKVINIGQVQLGMCIHVISNYVTLINVKQKDIRTYIHTHVLHMTVVTHEQNETGSLSVVVSLVCLLEKLPF